MGDKILICISKRGRGRMWAGLIWTRGVMSCRQVETHRHLRGTGCLPPSAVSDYPEDGGDMLLQNVGEFPTDKAAPHAKDSIVQSPSNLKSCWRQDPVCGLSWTRQWTFCSLKRRGNSEKLSDCWHLEKKKDCSVEFSFKWKMRTVHTARLLNICCQWKLSSARQQEGDVTSGHSDSAVPYGAMRNRSCESWGR